MRGPLGSLPVCALLSSFLGTVLAKDDPAYSPSDNWRPQNVTGLNGMYSWVGSYYNGTTVVKITPEMGFDPTDPLCAPLKNYTQTLKWDSILTVMPRGSYNTGPNAVNAWLTLIPPNYDWSTLPPNEEILQDANPTPFWWALDTSYPTWREDGNKTAVEDNFNFTLAKTDAAYFMSGEVQAPNTYGSFNYDNVTMPACNSTEYDGTWRMSLFQVRPGVWWSTKGWKDYALPIMRVNFDAESAELLLVGDFQAGQHVRHNATDYTGNGESEVGVGVQGSISFSFKGALDAYHSDVLNMNTSIPTWLRTVGFGNNSLNIDNTNSNSNAAGRVSPGQWVATAMMAVSAFVLLY